MQKVRKRRSDVADRMEINIRNGFISMGTGGSALLALDLATKNKS